MRSLKVVVAHIEEKLRKTYVRWHEYVLRHSINASLRQCEIITNTH